MSAADPDLFWRLVLFLFFVLVFFRCFSPFLGNPATSSGCTWHRFRIVAHLWPTPPPPLPPTPRWKGTTTRVIRCRSACGRGCARCDGCVRTATLLRGSAVQRHLEHVRADGCKSSSVRQSTAGASRTNTPRQGASFPPSAVCQCADDGLSSALQGASHCVPVFCTADPSICDRCQLCGAFGSEQGA